MSLRLGQCSLTRTQFVVSSYSGYGKIGFDRRFRVYDVSDYGETIRTYKRTEKDEILDEMVLIGKGAPAPYEGYR